MIALKMAGLDKKPFYPVLAGVFLLYVTAVYIAALNGFVDKFELTDFGWKITNKGGFWGTLYSRTDDLCSAVIIGCVIYFSSKSRDTVQKLQAASLIAGIAVTLFFIYLFRFMPGGTALSNSPDLYLFSTALGIFTAMTLYGFMELTPSYAANSIFNNAFEMMALVKNDGTIEAANTSLSRFTCGKDSGCNGIHFNSLFSGTGAIGGQILSQAMEKGGVHSEYVTLKRHDGTEAGCLLSAVMLKRRGLNYGIACVMSDISELRKAEAKLEEYRLHLEELVEKRTAELDSANKKLSIRVNTTEDFIKASYHDLREPVSSTARLLHQIMDRAKTCAAPEIFSLMKEASAMASRTDTLISDIRDYMFIDNSFAPESGVDLNGVLKESLTALKDKILSANATITVKDTLPVLRCSRSHALMLFNALFDNALKFNKSGKPGIAVFTRVINGRTYICVSDNGIGIAEEYRKKIFKAFERLHSREEYAGNGIGLAMCRKIAELHGGEIFMEPAENGGSVFVFTLT